MFLIGYVDMTSLVPADPYTPNVIRNLKDKPVRLPQDKLVPTTFIQATEPENAKGGDVWIRT